MTLHYLHTEIIQAQRSSMPPMNQHLQVNQVDRFQVQLLLLSNHNLHLGIFATANPIIHITSYESK